MNRLLALVATITGLVLSAGAHADSWAPPEIEAYVSADRRARLTVTPRDVDALEVACLWSDELGTAEAWYRLAVGAILLGDAVQAENALQQAERLRFDPAKLNSARTQLQRLLQTNSSNSRGSAP